MFTKVHRLVLVGVAAGWAATAPAVLIHNFNLDSTGGGVIVGDTLTNTLAGLVADGVTFDAMITVVGSGNLNHGTTGLGVDGGSTQLDNGESLAFSMVISNEVGGTVAFDFFEEIDYNTMTGSAAEELSTLSDDNSLATLGDNFLTSSTGAPPGSTTVDLVDISGFARTAFFLFADDANSAFRIDDITAQFTGTVGAPVPEPSTYALLALLMMVGWTQISRRRRN